MKPPKEMTQHKIAELTGADRASVSKWIRLDGIQPVRLDGSKKLYGPDALAAVRARCKRLQEGRKNGEPNIDPETGLTWAQRESRERSLLLACEREEKERDQSEKWLTVEQHVAHLKQVMDRIENMPGRAKSELGLNDIQGNALRRLVDECRQEAAKAIKEGM